MTDKHIPASKLLALKDYWDERMGCMTVRSDDLRALIDAEPDSNLIAELVEALEGLYKFASAKSTRIDTLLKRAKEALK